jgi:hypothetical protein
VGKLGGVQQDGRPRSSVTAPPPPPPLQHAATTSEQGVRSISAASASPSASVLPTGGAAAPQLSSWRPESLAVIGEHDEEPSLDPVSMHHMESTQEVPAADTKPRAGWAKLADAVADGKAREVATARPPRFMSSLFGSSAQSGSTRRLTTGLGGWRLQCSHDHLTTPHHTTPHHTTPHHTTPHHTTPHDTTRHYCTHCVLC